MEKASPTQRDVARAAGVCVSTVSLALRNHPSIPSATCRRIQTIASSMGYHQDAILTQAMTHLRRGAHGHDLLPLAILHGFFFPLPISENPHFREFWEAARIRANELGYYLEEFWMREPGMTPARLRGILKSRGIRGIIFSLPVLTAGNALDFDLEGFCAVNSGACRFFPPIHSVMSHPAQSIGQCVQNLVDRGCRRLGLVPPMEAGGFLNCETEAVFEFLARRAPAVEFAGVFRGEVNDSGFALATWAQANRLDVVIGTPQVLADLRAQGLSVPRDIGFVGLGVSLALDACSGMDRRNAHQASALVDLLVAHLQRNDLGVPPFAKGVMIESVWVDGGTVPATRPPAPRAAASPPVGRRGSVAHQR